MSDERKPPASGLRVILVMGVEGSGKTTVGRMLARAIGWEFLDADDFHTPEAKAKMAAGVPLTDDDRRPWLQALHGALGARINHGRCAVMACSALKQSYREALTVHRTRQALVYLRGDIDLIRRRLEQRKGHYAGLSLLESQFQTLEEPRDAIIVDIANPPDRIVAKIRAALNL